jgi:hypothetical protein
MPGLQAEPFSVSFGERAIADLPARIRATRWARSGAECYLGAGH